MLDLSQVKSEGNFVKQDALPAGSYPARLVEVIDMGLQEQSYEGSSKPAKNEIQLTYEFTDEFMLDEDGVEILDKPRWLSERVPLNSLSSDLAKSTKRYMVFDPELTDKGNFVKQLSKPVMVTVVANPGKGKKLGETVNYIAGISAMRPKEVGKLPEMVGTPSSFDLDSPDLDKFNSLPDWIKDKIKSSLNFNGSELQKLLSDNSTESVEENATEQSNEEGFDEPW